MDVPNYHETLLSEVRSYIEYSQTWMRFWGWVYYTLRTALIVLSACVAAKDTLGLASRQIAIMALLVAIGTSIDTWLKTGSRYRGHYSFNDKFIALCTDLEISNAADPSGMEKIQEQLKKLIDDYAVAVLPS